MDSGGSVRTEGGLPALLISTGPRRGSTPLIVFSLPDLYEALTAPPRSLSAEVRREAGPEEAWIQLPWPVEEGVLELPGQWVDYGENSRRWVYPGPSWPTTGFGFTVNQSGWSSYPPHGFERGGRPPRGFQEVFFFLVRREDPWWMGPACGYLVRSPTKFEMVFDQEPVRISPGLHAVAAAPGCRLGYLWAYHAEEPIVKEIVDGRYVEDAFRPGPRDA